MIVKQGDGGTIYRQIYRRIREEILSGRLARGARLPSTRLLAGDAGVSRNSVLAAYDQLIAEGYLETRRGRGTFVSPEIPEDQLPVAAPSRKVPRPPATLRPRLSRYGRQIEGLAPSSLAWFGKQLPYDFRLGMPDVADFPNDQWRRVLARRMRAPTLSSIGYGQPEGSRPLREAIAAYLGEHRAVRCEADQVLIVGGSQQALDLTARVFLDPGEAVVIEDPHYLGARQVFQGAGARLVPAPVGAEGVDCASLGKAATSARLVYVTPSHQFPTGAIMTISRRLELLRWAATNNAYVIEDDYDSEYRYEGRPVESIQGLDRRGQVIYMGTLSRVMFPALRLGYMVVPEPLVEPYRNAKWLTDRHCPLLEQEALADFITEGHFERHLRRSRARYAARRTALIGAVSRYLGDRVEVSGANAGIHVLLRLRDVPRADADTLVEAAEAAGVGVYSASRYYLRPPRHTELLLGFGCMGERQIRLGIRCLARVLEKSGTLADG